MASSNRGAKANKPFHDAIGVLRKLGVATDPIIGADTVQPLLQHGLDLRLALRRLDIPGESHQVAPVAVGVEQLERGFDVTKA